ncbi:hypothetical protein A3J43_00825 [Candidatus Uhrbacteria bacterium RIFCSPHIGHO2_12_FULL_54_23]|uniref:Transcriptional repressor PaaX-like central Cas2-like domain-containing protein n=3 Tax=Candidatus Uhriibacteriota TaxID=1752732 RepID=A0A1F7UKV6_9BACT|nr:MAG: hypothetical protein A3J43_00825 [Candidatus Uhrbacteria bacterium RIFCSPHIGHO2_12_FULL_54_23]OGL85568.1 MAG: hypothetical protein A3B36_00740 [Candidatus Uhrbacteria bacterium RIFCSPLOWO2_01_FULL_55_36]OGL90796.1 MAG: hypothetical protein A3J36_03380 [Candidatus Uhrbacteria bacterium RIFCSPLOWO2_02_FULL_54_37]
MSLRVKEPFTEKVLAKLTELEPMFSMTSGAAMELFGFNDLRKTKRWNHCQREKARRERTQVMKAFENLMRADLVTLIKGKRGSYRLTPKGWVKYALYYAQHIRKEKKMHKKGRGYIIIFDIPEKYRGFRDTLRRVLYALKYTQLQKSVFLTYDAEAFEFAGRVIANCELEDRVKCVIAEKVF